jgi:hypothetical protein
MTIVNARHTGKLPEKNIYFMCSVVGAYKYDVVTYQLENIALHC